MRRRIGAPRAGRTVTVTAAVLLVLSTTACSGPESVPLDDAQQTVQSLVPALQDAFAIGEDLEWTGLDREALAVDDDGTCRWRAGTWSTPLSLPEHDPDWDQRRDRINEVLADHDVPPMGRAGYTGGGPAYGSKGEGPHGGTLRIDSRGGETSLYLNGIAVEVDGPCDDSTLTG